MSQEEQCFDKFSTNGVWLAAFGGEMTYCWLNAALIVSFTSSETIGTA